MQDAPMVNIQIKGTDAIALLEVLERGIDHGGNPVEPFVDIDGGWPLRCCLEDSRPGDEIAIIAWCPFPWKGPYAETGPVVVHADECVGSTLRDHLPPELDGRAMTLRPYGMDHRIAYGKVRHVAEGESLTALVEELLGDPDIEMVHGRNVTGGCFSFQANRRMGI